MLLLVCCGGGGLVVVGVAGCVVAQTPPASSVCVHAFSGTVWWWWLWQHGIHGHASVCVGLCVMARGEVVVNATLPGLGVPSPPPTNHLSQSNQTSLAAPCQHTHNVVKGVGWWCLWCVMVACLCFNTLGAMVNHHHHHCVVAILCHHAMSPHPCHPHQTMSTGVQCVGVVPAVHTPHKPVCCMHCMVCVVVCVVCSFTLVLMPHHQLCTPWAAMPWCVATSVFVLCVSCLPLCPPPPQPCCTIGVCVCGWSTPGQRCCWAVCCLVSLITLLHHTPFLLFVLQLVCCAVCGSACVATCVVCVGACCCTLPQSPSQALVNVAPGCPCVVMLHHTCVCQVVLFGHTGLTTMWCTLLMVVSLAVHMWWLFVTT